MRKTKQIAELNKKLKEWEALAEEEETSLLYGFWFTTAPTKTKYKRVSEKLDLVKELQKENDALKAEIESMKPLNDYIVTSCGKKHEVSCNKFSVDEGVYTFTLADSSVVAEFQGVASVIKVDAKQGE